MEKMLLIIPFLLLFSCKTKIIETKLKVFYNDGRTEIIKIKRHSNVLGKHSLFNGCLYRYKHEGYILGDESSYIGQLRCNVSYIKTLSIKLND